MKYGKHIYIEYESSEPVHFSGVDLTFVAEDQALLVEPPSPKGCYYWIPYAFIKSVCVQNEPFEVEED